MPPIFEHVYEAVVGAKRGKRTKAKAGPQSRQSPVVMKGQPSVYLGHIRR